MVRIFTVLPRVDRAWLAEKVTAGPEQRQSNQNESEWPYAEVEQQIIKRVCEGFWPPYGILPAPVVFQRSLSLRQINLVGVLLVAHRPEHCFHQPVGLLVKWLQYG